MTNAQLIAAVTRWQSQTGVAAFTCGAHVNHRPLQAAERDGQVIMTCPDCKYWQWHIPEVIKRGYF
jgi:hypothetical protein